VKPIVETFSKRVFAFAALALLAAFQPAAAQVYPTKPIRIIVPYAAGGVTDQIARLVGAGLSQRLGQPVVVDNRPGGNTVSATHFIAKAPPDGYTLYLNTPSSYSINIAYYKSLPYTRTDYTAVAITSEIPLGLYVATDSPFKTLADVVNHAKANPGKLNYGSAGMLTQGALGMEIIKATLGLNIQGVPYQGNAPALVALLGGQVELMLSDIASAAQHIQAGKLRVLAVNTDSRLPNLPDVPTLAEAGFPQVKILSPWNGVFGPPGLPKPIVDKLNAEINAVMKSPEGQKFLAMNTLLPTIHSPEKMQAMVQTDYDVYAPLLTRLGLKSTE
jgi:tripartite-type tricarboxylate transporter receptor subunit TctC